MKYKTNPHNIKITEIVLLPTLGKYTFSLIEIGIKIVLSKDFWENPTYFHNKITTAHAPSLSLINNMYIGCVVYNHSFYVDLPHLH